MLSFCDSVLTVLSSHVTATKCNPTPGSYSTNDALRQSYNRLQAFGQTDVGYLPERLCSVSLFQELRERFHACQPVFQ